MNCYTLRATLNFKEDSNIRHVEPAFAYLLELKRIIDHHDINLKYTDPEGHVHIYLAKEKANPSVQKMFVRLLIRPTNQCATIVQCWNSSLLLVQSLNKCLKLLNRF